MKKHYLFLVLCCMLLSVPGYSQTGPQKDTLRAIAAREVIRSKASKAKAVEWANRNGYPVTQEKDGTFIEIQYIDENNRPQYYGTDNATAAATISTNKVYAGGEAGLNLSGSGISVSVWDAGSVRSTHQEFGGRVTVVDPVTTNDHSTHVAGTIMASGVVAIAKGMAFEAGLRSLDWNNDAAEMATEAIAGALISSHSYGYIRGWYSGWWYGDPSISTLEDYRFGFYNYDSEIWDEIARNAPNYLICKSAGNDRGNSGDGSYPPDGPYDCIGEVGIAKNILTVGAVDDIPGGYVNPWDVVMSSFSSWGPADDGRIKPDIVANGIGLYSTDNTADDAYLSLSGTSMATPSVAGSLALLQQHYYALNGSYMRAATLKALVIHTADEAGTHDGPDYEFGWGLMNTKNAALKITADETTDVMNELTLVNGSVYTRDIVASGEPIKVTIVWTDPAGTPVATSLDPINPMLVNDLDLRITKAASTWLPWKLERDNPANAATNSAENNIDNVEMVYLASPVTGETYTITVDNDGTLTGTTQDFSMIISGILVTQPPEANFVASTTHPLIDSQVNFTDLSTNIPTTWNWSFNPSTVTYLNETTSTSQNPQVMFTERRSYSVTLISTNAYGTDTETKTGYIDAFSCFFSENFIGTTIPLGWTQVDHQGNGQIWEFGMIAGFSPDPALTGNYAYLNSDAYGGTSYQNVDLITPTLDFSTYTDGSLQFDHYFKYYPESSGTLSYSIDGGSTWTAMTTFSSTSTTNPANFYQLIPEVAGQANVKFKWNYTGHYGYYWAIDNVQISGSGSNLPDLAVSSLTFTPTRGARGTVLNISTTVKNIGTTSTGAASTIRYYFSENYTWESTDQYIGVDGVGDLSPDATSPETINWTIPTSLALGDYYVIVRVDVNNTVSELDESNDLASATTFEVVEKPDLVVSALTFTPTSGVGGTVLNIRTTIMNTGTVSSGTASTIRYYFSANSTWESTDTYIGVDGVGILAVGNTSPETISWTVPTSLAVGNYYVIVRVDVNNTVTELDESNEFASVATFGIMDEPDLVISALTFTPAIGARGTVLNISTTVKNIGAVSSGAASTIRYYFSENSTWESTDPYIGVDGVGDLAADGTSPETISWTVPLSIAVGSYYVIVRVDATNKVSESDESNDFASVTTFNIVEQPDLVIYALTFAPTRGAIGTVLSIKTTVKNIGTVSSGAASTIRYYFSANSTWESTDQSIGVDGVGDLAVGGTSPETISWTIPSSLALGNYYVIVRVDVNNTVSELDESNDFASVATFAVADMPDLVISELTFNPTSGVGGTILNISTTVENIGTASSGAACTIRYYFSVNNTWQSTDPYIGVDGVGDLAVGATSPETISWAVPSSLAAGSYYVIVRVDVTNTVSESNESNSFVSAGQFVIMSEPSIGGGGDGKATLDLLVREDPQMKSYPNPFVDQTTIHYTLAEDSKVLLSVYDMYGNLVFKLVDETIKTGRHQVDMEGKFIAKGMYYCVLTTPKGNYTLKMIKE